MSVSLLLCNIVLFANSVHPFLPVLATCSGQRKFVLPQDLEREEGGERVGGEEEDRDQEVSQNCLKVWSL